MNFRQTPLSAQKDYLNKPLIRIISNKEYSKYTTSQSSCKKTNATNISLSRITPSCKNIRNKLNPISPYDVTSSIVRDTPCYQPLTYSTVSNRKQRINIPTYLIDVPVVSVNLLRRLFEARCADIVTVNNEIKFQRFLEYCNKAITQRKLTVKDVCL